MFKKITLTVSAIFLASFLAFAITLPIGVKTTFGNITELLNTVTITPQRIDINANVETLNIDLNNYYYYSNHVLVKQSPDETAYIELFDADTYASNFDKINVAYIDENTAKISMEPVYGKFQFSKDTIQKTIVKEFQNYPDAILYIPTTVNIQTKFPYFFDNIYFKNKEEIMEQTKAQEQAEIEQEQIIQKAEELLRQRELEEERIIQKAEELLNERESEREQRELEREQQIYQREQRELEREQRELEREQQIYQREDANWEVSYE